MRKKNKLVYGIGINDYEGSVGVSEKPIRSYMCWCNMLVRCYDPKTQNKMPTYIGCTVCEEWLIFSNFKNWYDANYKDGFHLDKDILIEGNKVYSPETCVFVPQYLNSLLVDRRNHRGDLPLGVSAQKPDVRSGRKNTTYVAQCNNGYGKLLRKTFKTIEEASTWYSVTKTRVVAEQVQRALDAGDINQRVADALLSRKFC